MSAKVDLTALPRLIEIVEAQAATIPTLDWKNHSSSSGEQFRAIEAAKIVLEAAGARFSQKSYEHGIRLGGFRAGSTSSFSGALNNWLVAARKRLPAMNAPRTCRTCGCTDACACHNDVDGACWWVADDLCSHCQMTAALLGSRITVALDLGSDPVSLELRHAVQLQKMMTWLLELPTMTVVGQVYAGVMAIMARTTGHPAEPNLLMPADEAEGRN